LKMKSRFWAVAAFAFVVSLPTARHRNLSDCGGSSRLATAESLVERATFVIDESALSYTCDRMMIDGRSYSDKPPVLSVVAAVVYGALHHGFGLDFNPASLPGESVVHDHTYLLMTVLVVVVAHSLLMATFDVALGRIGLTGRRRLGALLAGMFGTLLWPLAGLFNSHSVAALLILIGLVWGLLEPARPALAGLALGGAATVDLPLGLLALAATWLVGCERARIAAGAVAPLGLHLILNWIVVGDLVPFQLHRELYNVATGHAGVSATGFAQEAGLPFYAVRNLVGAIGVFSLTPMLLLAVVLAVRSASRAGPVRRLAAVASGLFAAGLVLYTAIWPDAVGCSYGMRHLTPVTLPLLLAAAAAPIGRRAVRMVAGAGLLSVVLAMGGLLGPTTCSGFQQPERAATPAWVFFDNVRDGWARIGR